MADTDQAGEAAVPSRAERLLRGYLLGTVAEEHRPELDDVARHVVALLPQAAGAELLAARGQSVETVAVSDDCAALAEGLRRRFAAPTGDLLAPHPVPGSRLLPNRSWSSFVAALRAGTGLASFISLPVTPVEQFRVAVVIYGRGPDPLRDADPARVRLATGLAKNLIHSLVLRDQVDTLRLALDTNRQIGAAVGFLMAGTGLTQQDAFRRLQQLSQQRNVKLRDLADDILLTGIVPD